MQRKATYLSAQPSKYKVQPFFFGQMDWYSTFTPLIKKIMGGKKKPIRGGTTTNIFFCLENLSGDHQA
jgi:hypothetical protein